MIAIGATIGSGIFLTPSSIASALHSPPLIMLVWIVGGVVALSGALTFAELGAMMPQAGGVYVFLSEAYGKLWGFLYGWAYLLVVNTGAIAALSVASATYIGFFFPMSPEVLKIVAIVGIVIVTVVNILGVKVGGIFSDVFTGLKLLGILLLIVVGLLWGNAGTVVTSLVSEELPDNLSAGLAIAMIGVLWSYGGWQHVTYAAAEAKNPKRNIPIALLLGTFIVVCIYLVSNIAYMKMLTPEQIAASERVASDAMSGVIGPIGGSIIAVAIIISTFGTTSIYTLTAPRIYYAMANDGLFFKSVAKLHQRYQTPVLAITIQSLWAIVLILFWGTFENLISYVVFTDWIFFAMAAFSVFVFRRKRPQFERPYKTYGYPFTPAIFVLIAVWFVLTTIYSKPLQAAVGFGFLALGVPVYLFWNRKKSVAS